MSDWRDGYDDWKSRGPDDDQEDESYGRICHATGLYCTVECDKMFAPGGVVGPCPHPLKGKGDFDLPEDGEQA